jgi:copper chaperone CopZ
MELGELEGMESVEVDVPSKKATFRYDSPATEAEIRKSLQDINYPAEN